MQVASGKGVALPVNRIESWETTERGHSEPGHPGWEPQASNALCPLSHRAQHTAWHVADDQQLRVHWMTEWRKEMAKWQG